jgi:hypothetical protein
MTRKRTHGVSFGMRPLTLAGLALCGCLDVPRMPGAAGDAGVDTDATQVGRGGGGIVATPGGSGGEGGVAGDNGVGRPGGSTGPGGALVDSGVPGPGGAGGGGGAGGTPTDGAARWDQFNWDDGALWVE